MLGNVIDVIIFGLGGLMIFQLLALNVGVHIGIKQKEGTIMKERINRAMMFLSVAIPIVILSPLTFVMVVNAIHCINEPIGIYGAIFLPNQPPLIEDITFYKGGGILWLSFPIAFFTASKLVFSIVWIFTLVASIFTIRNYHRAGL